MKKLVLLLTTLALLISLVSPALADGTKAKIKRTVDKNGGITVSSEMEIQGTKPKSGTITPKAASPVGSAYCVAELFSNPLVGYYSGKSTAYTSSAKTTKKSISEVDVYITMEERRNKVLYYVTSNSDIEYNNSQAYCNDTYAKDLALDYYASSDHIFKNGGVQWTPSLFID